MIWGIDRHGILIIYIYIYVLYDTQIIFRGVIMVTQTIRRKVLLSATVDPELKKVAEEVAKENNTSTSSVVSQCLEELARNRKEKAMIKYYETMAIEHRDFAEKSVKVIQKIASSWGD